MPQHYADADRPTRWIRRLTVLAILMVIALAVLFYWNQQVRASLERDGWEITNDPLFIPTEGLAGLYIDLAARKVLSAQKGKQKIVVEIKGFGEQSLTHDFYESLGQALVYEMALSELGVDWPLFLAIPLVEFNRLEKVPLFIRIFDKFTINLIIIDTENQKIDAWRTQKNIKK